MFRFSFLFAVTIFISVQADVFKPKTDYCKISREHVGCNPINVSKTKKCDTSGGGGFFYLTPAERNLILHHHNLYRDELAGGNINGYPAADHMPAITWDPELEYLAALNAQRCLYDHDKTRATEIFKYAGQNIAELSSSESYSENNAGIKRAVFLWFDEYKDSKRLLIPQTQDKQCFVTKNGKQIGHFTAMSTDKTNKMGCAGLKYKKYNKQHKVMMFVFNVVCDYSYTNMSGEQTYVALQAGTKPGAGCKKQTTRIYKNLCKTTEPVQAIPNPPITIVNYYNGAGQKFKTMAAAKRTNSYPIQTETIRQPVQECPALVKKNN